VLALAEAAAAASDAALAAAREHLNAAELAHARAGPPAAARDAQGRADTSRLRLAVEADALAAVLAVGDGERWPPVMDQMQVPAGLEAALGAALGEGLAASDPGAARHWRTLPALPDRPVPGEAMSALVPASPALARALAGIGVVMDDAAGEAGQPGLLPGQCLVSRVGALWRWDGYTVRAGTPSAATLRLQQRTRLAGLRTQLAAADAVAAEARAACTAADAAKRAAAAAEAQARTGRRDAAVRAGRAGQAAAALQAQADAAAAALDQARTQRAGLPDPGQLGAAADQAHAVWVAARARDAAATRALEAATRDDAARRARRAVLAQERADWARRATEAAHRVTDLRARQAEAEREHVRLCAEPAGTASQAEAATLLQQAKDADRVAAAALVAADRRAGTTAQGVRIASAALAQAREAWVRAEAASGQAEQAWAALPPAIEQPIDGATPPHPAADTLPDLSAAAEERARAELAALLRQRDALGPVNLRAAVEAAMQATTRVRDELATAIAALRGSLGELDREARARLTAVFQQVDAEFQALFARMFGGGRAHLALVGSDDPLQAGLEIYAQPPGKRLSALSLLSGGEQALAALSLIFAVFRCNPAPVCVLDEVDAPLDDANVERLISQAWPTATRRARSGGGSCQCRLHSPQIGRLQIPQFGAAAAHP